ncbi:MAG TPA: hypothetical protein VMU84_08400 [Thermoanaerobaculia bacterium]|nr:hypothetical protein [Thermoanaerobaculia bacterium]
MPAPSRTPSPSRTSVARPEPVAASVAIFRYDGRTTLTVIGRVTGRRYWFREPGAEIAVELRDRASMQQVPNVREVRLA